MRNQSVYVEFLIYTSIAIALLSLVLYNVKIFSDTQSIKMSLNYMEKLSLNIYHYLSYTSDCYECENTYYGELPNMCYLTLTNNTIISTCVSTIFYNYTSNEVNVNIEKIGSLYFYNLSLNYYYFIANLTERGNEFCLVFLKNTSGLYVLGC